MQQRTDVYRNPAAVAEARAGIDGFLHGTGLGVPRRLQRELRNLMSEHAGVVRGVEGLKAGLAKLATLECALERRETRGCHNRSDSPSMDAELRGNIVWTPSEGVVSEAVPDAPEELQALAEERISDSVEGKLVE